MRIPAQQRFIAPHSPAESAHKHPPSRLHAQMVASPQRLSSYNRTNKLRPFCLMSPSRRIPLSSTAKVRAGAAPSPPRLQRSSTKSVEHIMDEPARANGPFRPFFVSLAFLTPLLCCPLSVDAQPGITPHIEAIRFWSFGDVTRIAIQTQGSYQMTSDQVDTPPRLYFDLNGLRPPASAHHGIETFQVGDHRLKKIRVSEINPGTTRVVFDLEGPVDVVSSQLVNPDRLMIELRPKDTSLPASSSTRNVKGPRHSDLPAPVIVNPAPTRAANDL